MERPTILVVDNDTEMRALLTEVLSREGYLVEEAANGNEALSRLRTNSFAAIIMDKNLPGLGGLYLLSGLRVICQETPVILITTLADSAPYLEGLKKGAFEYVFKPFRIEELLRVLRRALLSEVRSTSSNLASGGAG
ncbi:MAG TPA: response regulator [archaeon]|nr:response regulator [archaeon]